jgi:hypothetical protein
MLIGIGEPFPELGKQYRLGNDEFEYTADVHFLKVHGWRTKGKVGVIMEVTAMTYDFKRLKPKPIEKPKLTLVEIRQ